MVLCSTDDSQVHSSDLATRLAGTWVDQSYRETNRRLKCRPDTLSFDGSYGFRHWGVLANNDCDTGGYHIIVTTGAATRLDDSTFTLTESQVVDTIYLYCKSGHCTTYVYWRWQGLLCRLRGDTIEIPESDSLWFGHPPESVPSWLTMWAKREP